MLVRRAAATAALLVLAACRRGGEEGGPNSDTTTTRAAIVPAAKYPAVAPPLPALAYAGGRFVRRPQVVTVTFAGDDPESVERLEQFGSVITRGRWWSSVTAGLCGTGGDCVGVGGDALRVRLPVPPDRTIAAVAIEALGGVLASAVATGTLPAPSADTLYLVYLPKEATFDAGKSCAFGGARARHASFLHGVPPTARVIPYAAVLRCGDLAETMASAAHEVLEMATDPEQTGFHLDAGSPFALFGRKAVDPCNLVTLDNHRVTVDGHVFHRAWSNAEAAAGHDPCVPRAPGGTHDAYFGAVPAAPIVELGAASPRASIEWTAFSERPLPDWAVSAVEIGRLADGARCVDVTLSARDVNNGTKFRADLVLVEPNCPHVPAIGLVSTLGARSHVWPLALRSAPKIPNLPSSGAR